MELRSAQNAFRQVSKLISLQQLQYRPTVRQFNPDYYIRPLCTRNAFDKKIEEVAYPLTAESAKIYHPSPRYSGGLASGLLDPVRVRPALVDPGG